MFLFLFCVFLIKTFFANGAEWPNITVNILGPYSPLNEYGVQVLAIWSIIFDDLNANPNASAAHNMTMNFVYTIPGTGREEPLGISNIASGVKSDVSLFVGPWSECLYEPELAATYNKPMITATCDDPRIDGLSYDTFISMVPDMSDFDRGILAILSAFNWTTVVPIWPYYDGVPNSAVALYSELLTSLQASGITVHQTYTYCSIWAARQKTIQICRREQPGIDSFSKSLMTTFQSTRIYIFMSVTSEQVTSFLQMMDRMGLLQTGEYFVLTLYQELEIREYWSYLPAENQHFLDPYWPWETYFQPDSMNETAEWMRGTLATIHTPALQGSQAEAIAERVWELWTSPAAWPCPPICMNKYYSLPNYTSDTLLFNDIQFYDIMMAYGELVTQLWQMGLPIDDGRLISSYLRNRTYTSVGGYKFQIGANGRVTGNMTLLYPGLTPGLGIWPVGTFVAADAQMHDPTIILLRFMSGFNFSWISGNQPTGEPLCGFSGAKCTIIVDLTYIWIICGTCFGLIASLSISIGCYRQWKHEYDLHQLLWRIDPKLIELTHDRLMKSIRSSRSHEDSKLWGHVDSHASLEVVHSKAELVIAAAGLPDRSGSFSDKKTLLPKHFEEFRLDEVEAFHSGLYRGRPVGLKRVFKQSIELCRTVEKELQEMRDLKHANLCEFVGVILESHQIFIVLELCSRGDLMEILRNDELKLDNIFIASIVFDIVKGMNFIHDSSLVYHGNLKSTNCLVDSKWCVRLSGYGLREFRSGENNDENPEYSPMSLLWTAPEHLRVSSTSPPGSPAGDVYSFGIILHEVLARAGPFGGAIKDAADFLSRIRFPSLDQHLLRPDLSKIADFPPYILSLILECWDENAEARPSFLTIKNRLKPLGNGLKGNIFDNVAALMDQYTDNLESLVSQRQRDLETEQLKNEQLLLRLLPLTVSEQLKAGKQVEAETFDDVSIYFSDIVGFTQMSSTSTAMQVVTFLNELYTGFDALVDTRDAYKLETIGDAYMAVSGVPARNDAAHSNEIAALSLDIVEFVKTFKIRHRPNDVLRIRVGLHCGTCVAGVVGLKMPRYCLFGETVTIAQLMESRGEALKVHCSEAFMLSVSSREIYTFDAAKLVDVPNKASIQTYWLFKTPDQVV